MKGQLNNIHNKSEEKRKELIMDIKKFNIILKK